MPKHRKNSEEKKKKKAVATEDEVTSHSGGGKIRPSTQPVSNPTISNEASLSVTAGYVH